MQMEREGESAHLNGVVAETAHALHTHQRTGQFVLTAQTVEHSHT